MQPSHYASAALFAFAVLSCKSAGPPPAPAPPTLEELMAVPIFAAPSGEAASLEEIGAAIAEADVVIFGELHGHPVGLPLHAELFRMAASENTALCLEFLTRESQFLIDAYLADVIEWDTLGETLAHIRGSTATPHRQLIEIAREAGGPVIAANAPRIYNAVARTKGYDALEGLSQEQSRLFDVPLELPSGPYRVDFFKMMRQYEDEPADEEVADEEVIEEGSAEGASADMEDSDMEDSDMEDSDMEDSDMEDSDMEDSEEEDSEEDVEEVVEEPSEHLLGMFRSQALWDGTMSASVVRAVESGNRPVFLVIGSFHCNNNGGTLQLLRQRLPDAKVLIVSFVNADSDALREEDEGLADFVAYVGPYPGSEDE